MAPRRTSSSPERARPPAPRRRGGGKAATPRDEAGAGVIEEVAARLTGLCQSLEKALDQAPRAADFEPLSEHLYELARHSPRLIELLEAAPAAEGPLGESVGALREVLSGLEAVQASLSESLLQLPRAEDYDPLTTPLREFARKAPPLLEGLADVPHLTRALAETISGIDEAARGIESSRRALDTAAEAILRRPGAAPPTPDLGDRIEGARATLSEALDSLPRSSDYAPLAAQLRELATVSPSLMEWLSEVPKVTEPLAGSVERLRATAESLAAIRDEVRGEAGRDGGRGVAEEIESALASVRAARQRAAADGGDPDLAARTAALQREVEALRSALEPAGRRPPARRGSRS